MLKMAADRTEGLLKTPEPFVLQQGLADFAVNYEINAYCNDEKRSMQLYTDLHRNIQDVFNEHEVQIMTPNYMADTPDPKVVPEDQWYAASCKTARGKSGPLAVHGESLSTRIPVPRPLRLRSVHRDLRRTPFRPGSVHRRPGLIRPCYRAPRRAATIRRCSDRPYICRI